MTLPQLQVPTPDEAAPPDFMLEINPDQNPSLTASTMYASLVDASKLVGFLQGYGGKVFTWRYATDRPMSSYTVECDLIHPLPPARLEEIVAFIANIQGGGRVKSLTPQVREVISRLHKDGQVIPLVSQVTVSELVMEFPVLAVEG